MMVSKVAVIALVAIVACPILLGYAMNLSEVTVIDYEVSGDQVNVTPLLQNDNLYTSISADTYAINSNFGYQISYGTVYPIIPNYESITSNTTSMQLNHKEYHAVWYPGVEYLTNISKYYAIIDYDRNLGSISFYVYHDSTLLQTISYVHEVYYDKTSDSITYTYWTGSVLNANTISGGDYTSWTFTNSNNVYVDLTYGYQYISGNSSYVDISSGYHFDLANASWLNSAICLPDNTKSFILTLNLDSITAANYSTNIEVRADFGPTLFYYTLAKTTVGSEVTWTLTSVYNPSDQTVLYMDPSRNDNTYQLFVEISKESVSDTYDKVTIHKEMRYIGGWQKAIGPANVYIRYTLQDGIANVLKNMVNGMKTIGISGETTPTMRMDSAIVDGYVIPVINDQVYNPSMFRENPSTTITDISLYGSSILFGGNTYAISNGKITIGSHQLNLENLAFESVLNENGTYDNRISGTVVSTTADPSTITFKGNWSASVATDSMKQSTYTKTEWVPGAFGWNGLDHNFLIVGLITSLGAFIGVGIYARRTKTGLWPLLIVCGGAAVLFFIML